jgi:hypothetical protein
VVEDLEEESKIIIWLILVYTQEKYIFMIIQLFYRSKKMIISKNTHIYIRAIIYN